jgi:hypothetical protein
MPKTRTNETQTPETANPLPELSLQELSAVRGGGCRRGCGSGRGSN